MQQFRDTVDTPTGRPIPGATVTVTISGGGTPTLYSDNGTTALGSNVLTTDGNGEYKFYAPNGRYTFTIAATGYTGTTRDVVLFDPRDVAIGYDADPGDGGFWPNVDADAKIVRLRDRLFVGGGAAFTGGFTATQGGFVNTSTDGAQWAPRDSALFAAQDIGLMVITAFASNENMDLTGGQPSETIALSGFTINAQATRTTWAGYLDIQHEAGVASYGIEIAAKNKSTDKTDTPYTTSGGVYGIWFAGGGDTAYGGSWTNPSNTAIKIGKNDPVGTTWNKGIVFVHDGLTGSDGTTGTATAIEMGYGQQIVWRAPGNYGGFAINSEVSTSGANSSLLATDNNVILKGPAGAFMAQFTFEASGVNYLRHYTRATGSGPRISAEGETNVNLELYPKGTGALLVGGLVAHDYADDAAAATGGVPVGGIYHNAGAARVRRS